MFSRWFAGIEGFYISIIMHYLESAMAISTELYCLFCPISFLRSLYHGVSTDILEHPLVRLLTSMAANGMLLAGMAKWYILQPHRDREIKWWFCKIEVIIKMIHFSITIIYAWQIDLSSWSSGLCINLALSAFQFLALSLSVMYEIRLSKGSWLILSWLINSFKEQIYEYPQFPVINIHEYVQVGRIEPD